MTKMMLFAEKEGLKPSENYAAERIARNLCGGAFRALAVKRPQCECLSPKRADMHHHDYEKWWLVGFLCPKCHNAEHWGRLLRPYRLYDVRRAEDFSA